MRLRSVTWDELITRSGQEFGKRWDLACHKLGLKFVPDIIPAPNAPSGSFFFSSTEIPTLVSTMRERFPEEFAQTIQQAEQICKHEFDLLGYKRIPFGPQIDWHSDLVHGKRASQRPWFQIRYLDFDEVGDSKIIWELNRHQHLVTLAKAYRFTDDARFANELFSQWFDWQDRNPYPFGINWASSLEVAFRALSWLWVVHLMADTPAVPARFASQSSEALALSGRHLEKYLSTYFSPNTHLLGEGVALFFIGVLCRHLPHARRWKERGWSIVNREAARQVRVDGTYFEQSLYYHVYALDLFLHARILASKNNIAVLAELDDTLVKMLEFLASVSQAGRAPRLGDDDGGRLFDPQRNGTAGLMDPLSTGAALYKRADFKAAVGSFREESLWLLGMQGPIDFDSLPSTNPLVRSAAFRESGIYVLADAEPKAQMIIDAGPQGSLSAGHGHADALNICFAAEGRDLLIDPGTYCYVSADNSRNEFRGTAAHNCLRVDEADQSVPAGPFSWKGLVETKTDMWVASDGFELFRGFHTGYSSREHAVIHRRDVFHLKSNFWFVRDVANGDGEHPLDLFWHLAPGITLERIGSAVFLFEDREGMRFALLSNDDSGWTASLEKGWWSPVYGKKELAPVLRFHRKSRLPAELCSLFLPASQSPSELGRLQTSEAQLSSPSIRAFTFVRPPVSHCFIFNDAAGSWRAGEIESDAKFVCCSFDDAESKRLRAFCFAEGSFLKWGGVPKFAAESPVVSYEWTDALGSPGSVGAGHGQPASAKDLAEDLSVSTAARQNSSLKEGS